MNNPVMYIAMEKAMTEANVPLPSAAERIFNAIKERPGITTPQLRKRLPAMPEGTIGSQLHKLKERGLVFSKPGVASSGRGAPAQHLFLTDTTTPYKEQLRATRPKRASATNRPAPLPKEAAVQEHQAESAKSYNEEMNQLIDSMTIRQAKDLYNRLRGIFA